MVRAICRDGWSSRRARRRAAAAETTAQAVLDAREQYPTSTLADLNDPLTMPEPLLKAHEQLDRAADRCYRPEPIPSDGHRVQYRFALRDWLGKVILSRAQAYCCQTQPALVRSATRLAAAKLELGPRRASDCELFFLAQVLRLDLRHLFPCQPWDLGSMG